MLNNFFKNNKKDVVAIEMTDNPTIDSKHIQRDIIKTFKSVLSEIELSQPRKEEISLLKEKLEDFKKSNKNVYSKIQQLEELGLTGTPSVKKTLKELRDKEDDYHKNMDIIDDRINNIEYISNLTKKYSLEYPTYKFVDNGTMVDIMKKYGLVMGEAFTYIKEIPDEALETISGFQKEIKDSEKEVTIFTELSSLGRKFYIHMEGKEHETKPGAIHKPYITFKISKLKMIAPENHFEIPKTKQNDWNMFGESKTISLMTLDEDTRRYVFDVSKLNENERKKQEILDPIACLDVEGGVIILAAWDKEAEIPEIQSGFLN